MIDKSSAEFMFGRILERLDGSDKTIAECKQEITRATEVLSSLPCKENSTRIGALEKCKELANGALTFRSQTVIRFKYAVLASGITAAVTALLTWLISTGR